MNAQANYVVQGFLLALLLPSVGFIMNKINSAGTTDETTPGVVYEELKKPDLGNAVTYKGKNLFFQKCASCHHLTKEGTGPALMGFQERGPWADRNKLHEWVKNPPLFMKSDLYTKKLKEKYGSAMTAFPDITREDVEAIAEYIIQQSVD
ncbi:MAG TPA: c-type cytochrome [Chitinophagaceae bacterium]|nr:c-type cytochrome [Chitinophagaceae bacterium]